jgi:hypothetical protein
MDDCGGREGVPWRMASFMLTSIQHQNRHAHCTLTRCCCPLSFPSSTELRKLHRASALPAASWLTAGDEHPPPWYQAAQRHGFEALCEVGWLGGAACSPACGAGGGGASAAAGRALLWGRAAAGRSRGQGSAGCAGCRPCFAARGRCAPPRAEQDTVISVPTAAGAAGASATAFLKISCSYIETSGFTCP